MTRQFISTTLVAATLFSAFVVSSTNAAVSLTGTTYFENFEGLAAGGSFTSNDVAYTLPGNTGWDGARIAGATATSLNISNGTLSAQNTGLNSGLYAFTNSLLERENALGAFASDFNTMCFGVALVNNSGQAIVGPTIKFDREQWRSSQSAVDVLNFAYGIGGTLTTTNYLSSTSMIAVPALNAVGDAAVGPGKTAGPTNGNNAQTMVVREAQLSGVTVPIGATIFLRWQDTNISGTDGALAIDNFSFKFTPAVVESPANVPEPTAIACVGMTVMALVTRRWQRAR